MTVPSLAICRPSGDVIKDPKDGILLGAEPTGEGSARAIYAHRDHANFAGPAEGTLRLLVSVLTLRLTTQHDRVGTED